MKAEFTFLIQISKLGQKLNTLRVYIIPTAYKIIFFECYLRMKFGILAVQFVIMIDFSLLVFIFITSRALVQPYIVATDVDNTSLEKKRPPIFKPFKLPP